MSSIKSRPSTADDDEKRPSFDAPRLRQTTFAPDLVLPRTATTHIPIGFRTLSIHVYDSQRFDHNVPQPKKRSTPRFFPWRGRGKDTESGNAMNDSADFFGKLDFHAVTAHTACQRLNVSPTVGLDSSAVEKRSKRNGANVLTQKKPQYWKKVLRYLFGGFCSILWVGVVIFFISWRPLGNPPAPYNLALAIVVLIVIFLQAGFSAFQDYSAGKIMASIMNLVPESATVLRDGEWKSVSSAQLVVGDIVQLATGQKVPADMRIIKASSDLKFDKAILTGEAEEVAGTVDSDEPNFLEAKNIALLGTFVCNGSGVGMVVLTGSRTVMGRINSLTNNGAEEETNLQKEINRFVKIIIALTISLVTIMLVTWLAWLRVEHFDFINTVGILTNLMSLVVAFIPEGMPIAVALTLSLVAKRMRDAKILPKSLSTVETLGFVNVICSDKTGTLTENKMSVVSLSYVDQAIELGKEDLESPSFRQFRKGISLCNDAFFEPAAEGAEPVAKGNATDCALLRLSSKYPSITEGHVRVYDQPFNSKTKYALTYVEGNQSSTIFVKGAPDILLDRCTSFLSASGTVVNLDATARARLLQMQETWSRLGQRVIMLTQREYEPEAKPSTTDFEQEITEAASTLTIVALIGIVDPPRADIPHTVSEARRCGARFFMVTGDFSLTAVAIAKQIGLVRGSADPDRIHSEVFASRNIESIAKDRHAFIESALLVEGKEIADIRPEQWDVVCKYEEIVFARTTPEQKLRIVCELRERGCVVAVTGDGVNDAPALKAANVGIAMVSGSEVAMEAADLILMEDFGSVIEGIRLGRLVFQNLQKVISYLLPAGSWSEDWPVILNVFFGCPLPLSSFLMIIICCFTDLFCCLTLIFEDEEFDLLTELPRDPKRSHLINLPIYLQSYGFIGTMETITAHSMFFYYIWSTAGIPITGMFFVFANYSDGYYGWSQDELNNFLNTGQCVYFVTLVILQIANLNSVRNKRRSIFQNGPQHNWRLVLGPIISVSIAIFVTMVPGMQDLFGTATVPIKFWLLPIPLAIGLLMMDEVRKVLVRAFPRGPIAKIAW